MIRAVCFDAGATLLHPDPTVEEVYGRVFREDGARFEPGELREALLAAWAAVEAQEPGDRYGGVTGEEGFWRAFLSRVRGSLDGGALSDEAFTRLAAHFRSPGSWAVYGDVVPALEDLSERGFALAVISNWDSHLPRLLEALRLSPFFRVVSVSAIEETGKPEAEIFRRTCERLGVRPGEALHVGDSPRDDVEGARGAGLSALLLDRDGRHAGAPDRITSLADIPSRLGKIPGLPARAD